MRMHFPLYILILILYKASSIRAYNQHTNLTLDRVYRVLDRYPIIDGHNDLAAGVRDLLKNNVSLLHLDHDLTQEEPWASYYVNHVDIPRMRKGKMGGQFWSAWTDCKGQFKDATQKVIEQIDVIRQFVTKYPEDLMWAESSMDIEAAMSRGKIGSLIGVEGGHTIGSSLPVLRGLYSLGVRYMSLTHRCNTPWADAAESENGSFPPRVNGLSDFGAQIVKEMNRLGMLVDLAHVSSDTMRQAIEVSSAPVMFSHSGARAVADLVRNVPDDVLLMVKKKDGIVMVNLYSCLLVEDCHTEEASVIDVVKHIDHIRTVAGVDHIGIGGDYNGGDIHPVDLPDVAHYPQIFAALIEDEEYDWSDEDLGKLASGNLIRVFKEVEDARDFLASHDSKPYNAWVPEEDLRNDTACMTSFF